jgi:hypothetical protein
VVFFDFEGGVFRTIAVIPRDRHRPGALGSRLFANRHGLGPPVAESGNATVNTGMTNRERALCQSSANRAANITIRASPWSTVLAFLERALCQAFVDETEL